MTAALDSLAGVLDTGPLDAAALIGAVSRVYFVDALSGTAFGSEYDLTFRVTTVPEPQAAALMFAGLGLLAALARRRAV